MTRPFASLVFALAPGLSAVWLAGPAVGTPATLAPPTQAPPRQAPATQAIAFAPGLVARAGGTGTVFVLGTARCGARLCLQLWKGQAGNDPEFTRVTAPPGNAPSFPGDTASVGRLVFANTEDGYALSGLGQDGSGRYYVTTDGAQGWRGTSFGSRTSVMAMTATPQAFYAVLARCTTGAAAGCRDYRLARSAVGSGTWTSVAIPGTGALDGAGVGLTAAGSQVWLTYQPPRMAQPRLLSAVEGRPPFTARAEPALGSVTNCALAAMPGGVVWAGCPTGMLVSWFRSSDGGQRFEPIWTTPGTGGGALDPVAAKVAYRYTGGSPKSPQTVQLSTDGGAHFRPVSKLAFNSGERAQLLFVNPVQGYALGSEADGPTLIYTADGAKHWNSVQF